jgi:hypothetical protein
MWWMKDKKSAADETKDKNQSSDLDRALTGGPSKVTRQPDIERIAEKTKAIDKNGKVIESKLKDNQRRLGVDVDHRTPEMKRRRRGTFP